MIWNIPKINEKNQKIGLEILLGLTHHSKKQYPQMLQNFFFNGSIGIFPKSHRLHKIVNRNTVKVSYSCMQNISKIYKWHSSKITSTLRNQLTLCNSWVKEECPMGSKCQTMGAVYDCCVPSPEPRKIYVGLAEGKWKQRYYNHKTSFNHKRYLHETALSSYMWHLKESLHVTPNLKWSVVMCVTPYSNISKKCLLCLYEKLIIIAYPRQHELLK